MTLKTKKALEKQQESNAEVDRISEGLKDEIEQGKVIVRAVGSTTVIHILERGSFKSGGADVQKGFKPVLRKIHDLLIDTSGVIRVAGHTDNVPISTARFRSNWALSSARAVSVAHEFMTQKKIDIDRFVVAGHADTKPIGDNATAAGRSINRRVDVSIFQGDSYFAPSGGEVLSVAEPADPVELSE